MPHQATELTSHNQVKAIISYESYKRKDIII